MAKRRDALIQQLPVDGAVSRDDARMLDCLERALNANRHALDALSNHQTVNEALIGGICLGIGYALVVYLIAGTAATAAPVEEPPRDREAKSEYSPTTLAPTAPPAPAQAPVPIPPRQLGLPPGRPLTPGCVKWGGTKSGPLPWRKIESPSPPPPPPSPPPTPPSPSPPPPSPPLLSPPPPSIPPLSPLPPSPPPPEVSDIDPKQGPRPYQGLYPPGFSRATKAPTFAEYLASRAVLPKAKGSNGSEDRTSSEATRKVGSPSPPSLPSSPPPPSPSPPPLSPPSPPPLSPPSPPPLSPPSPPPLSPPPRHHYKAESFAEFLARRPDLRKPKPKDSNGSADVGNRFRKDEFNL